MKKNFNKKWTVLSISLFFAGSLFNLTSCDEAINGDENLSCSSAEMKLPEIPAGTLFTEPIT